ncbi:DnaJ domain-containing protein, partial [Francisella tularensis]
MQLYCYYEILNVSKTASGVDIKRAYSKLAM